MLFLRDFKMSGSVIQIASLLIREVINVRKDSMLHEVQEDRDLLGADLVVGVDDGRALGDFAKNVPVKSRLGSKEFSVDFEVNIVLCDQRHNTLFLWLKYE